MFKKIIISVFVMLLSLTSFGLSEDFFYFYQPNENWINDPNDNVVSDLEIAKIIQNDAVKPQNSILYKLREVFKLTWWVYAQWDKTLAIDYIKMIINIALWLVGFIALILSLYAFYLMFFSKQEEWFEKAKKILKWVIIAIVIMWVSYFIVSMIFYFFGITSWTLPIETNPINSLPVENTLSN